MTCTGCLHMDYCIHFGCPFVRKPQSKESHSNKGGVCLENALNEHRFDLTQRRRQEQPQPRSEGSSAHDLEVRIGAAGKGPRISMRAQQARPIGSGCSVNLIQSLGVGSGYHQPRSNDRGRARDRAIGPADSQSSSRGGKQGALSPGLAVGNYQPDEGDRQPRETIHTSEHQVTDDAHRVRSAIVNSKSIPKFGCVNTGPNPQSMTGRKANTKIGPQSCDWIAGSGDTAAINSLSYRLRRLRELQLQRIGAD